MPFAVRGSAVLTSLVAGAVVASFSTVPIEQQVLDALNQARTDPAGHVVQLKNYKDWFKGDTVRIPGSPEQVRMAEGVDSVDETIDPVGDLRATG